MWSADTSQIRQSTLLFCSVARPSADTLLNIGCVVGLFTEAVNVGIVFATGEFDPCLEAVRE